MKVMYLKLYNPDPKDCVVKALDTYLTIPAHGFVVVSEVVGKEVQENHAQLEVVEATDEQYKEYRLTKEQAEKLVKEQMEAKAKVEAEAKRVEVEAKAKPKIEKSKYKKYEK